MEFQRSQVIAAVLIRVWWRVDFQALETFIGSPQSLWKLRVDSSRATGP